MAYNKFHNRKIRINEKEIFDSKKEYNRYQELLLLERAGEIFDLRRQVPFELIPAQKDEKTGKTIERACVYFADFTYKIKLPPIRENEGREVEEYQYCVEDTKSPATRTPAYIIKRKLMLHKYGIRIIEI